jgi:hypothetical protein
MVAAGAACGGFLFGFDTSTMNGAIIGIRSTLGLDAGTVGFVAAIALIAPHSAPGSRARCRRGWAARGSC